VRSGIVKDSIQTPVAVSTLGLDGDEQGDPSVHGGVDKAVYLYAQSDYDWWSQELGRELPAGIFGENLTLGGGDISAVRVGDAFAVGGAVLEASEPREPCFKLGAVMGDQGFLKRFRDAGRTGFYARVTHEGEVAAGDEIVLRQAGDPRNPTIAEIHRLYVSGRDDIDALTAALQGPDITDGWRSWFERRLEETLMRNPPAG
jgi:MOSC domain-containing protein YiiM